VGTNPSGANFYQSFATGANLSTYGIQLNPGSGTLGGFSAAYFDFFYSIANANAYADAGCPMELVLVHHA
jgi:hypothetical protein